jgi:hypothetical protein
MIAASFDTVPNCIVASSVGVVDVGLLLKRKLDMRRKGSMTAEEARR